MLVEKYDYSGLDRPEVLQTLFHPRREKAIPMPGIIDIEILVEEGVTVGGRFHMAGQDDPNILFFHGNDETANDYDTIGPKYVRAGLSLLAVDYRGYGISGGSPSVTSLMHDAHVILKYVKSWLQSGKRIGPLVVMGRSIGSASALELAAADTGQIGGLIIESGFSTTLPLLMALGVAVHSLGLTLKDDFGNVRKIARFAKPTLIIHAQSDQLIPLEDAEILQSCCAAKAKQFQVVPGADHNTIIDRTGKVYFQTIKQFTNSISGIRPKRREAARKKN